MQSINRDFDNEIRHLANNSPQRTLLALGSGWQWLSLNLIWLLEGDDFFTRYFQRNI